jgi:murein L,D-transpeptidase YcbB/YkuD
MIGKLFVPLAIGGGLIFLLSSAAGASPSLSAGSAPNPFDQLPDNLRQLAGQAQATNNPDMLEQMAAQLELRGFGESARVLRAQSTAIRQRSQNVFDQLPENLKQMAGQAQATNDPSMLEQVASQLETQGFREQAQPLRAQASALRQRSQALVDPPSSASPPAIVPSASSVAANPQPTALSPDLQKMVADAIQNGTPPILTSTAFVLEKAGFQSAADELKRRAKEAAASVPPPPVQDHPNTALDPSMPADLALQVARQLQLQGDPGALDKLATELRSRGFNTTADQVQAKAQQIRTMLDAARTMHDIDAEFKSPGIVAPPSATLPVSAAPFPSPAPPVASFPLNVTAAPSAPLPVPSTPQPQPAAPEKSKAQILAEALSGSLNDLLQRYGSVPKARFKEDKGLVTRFQSQEGLTADGSYGPTTAEHVGRYVADVPPPFYWKKGAGQKDLTTYRSNIHTLALEADQAGKADRAERLRQSALKASLA